MNNERKIEMHSFIQQGFISDDFSEMYSFKQQTYVRDIVLAQWERQRCVRERSVLKRFTIQ